jgi:hypothetical protein
MPSNQFEYLGSADDIASVGFCYCGKQLGLLVRGQFKGAIGGLFVLGVFDLHADLILPSN